MGAGACKIIIDGGKAYAAVENLADRLHNVNTYGLESAINVSCNIVTYVSLYLRIGHSYMLTNEYTQPIIDLHDRIIHELPIVEKEEAQQLVDELANQLYVASENVGTLIKT